MKLARLVLLAVFASVLDANAQTVISNPHGTARSSFSLFDGQYLGSRFTFSTPFELGSLAIDFAENELGGRKFFAAIVALPNATSVPTASASTGLGDLSQVVAWTLFDPGAIAYDHDMTVTIPLAATLNAGSYAVVIGAGMFGSPGGLSAEGGANGALRGYDVVTGSETLSWVSPSTMWDDVGLDDYYFSDHIYRLDTVGITVAGTAIPEPLGTALAVGLASLCALCFRRRMSFRRSQPAH